MGLDDKGFKVEDKRSHVRDDSGNFVRRDDPSDRPADSLSEPKAESEPASPISLPELGFAAFILSLNTNALVHLGLLPHPVTNETAVDLPLARQTIDLIAMLKEKTKNNLDPYEQPLVDQVLYELRLRYVTVEKNRGTRPSGE